METLRENVGIMGLADMFIKMGIRYGSMESQIKSDIIARLMIDNAIQASALIAKEKGTYDNYNEDAIFKSNFFITNTSEQTKELVKKYGLRNSQLLTIAPTGTLSTMLQISGGIEPIFANYYERKTESLHGEEKIYKVYTPIVEKFMKIHEFEDSDELPDYFVTAMDGVKPLERIAIQGVWQNCIDASISSTVNLPHEATVEEVEEVYMEAYKKGLKGVTIYRDGCMRSGILLTENSTKEDKEDTEECAENAQMENVADPEKSQNFEVPNTEKSQFKRGEVIEVRDDHIIARKKKLITGCGSLHFVALFDDQTGELLETYLSKGSTGGCANTLTGLSRMMSLSARAGVSVKDIVDQLQSTGVCPSYAVRSATKHDTSKGACCPMAVGNALTEMYKSIKEQLRQEAVDKACEKVNEISETLNEIIDNDNFDEFAELGKAIDAMEKELCPECEGQMEESYTRCPECGEKMRYEGGCVFCPSCGYSKCD